MATLTTAATAVSGYDPQSNIIALSVAQTGNGASTNVADRRGSTRAALIQIVSTIGATPTVTVAVQGSIDNTNWFSVPIADVATPTTVVVTTFAITTATTTTKIVQADTPVRYLRLLYSANTNVTLTADVAVF
jgi:hypothetical protein